MSEFSEKDEHLIQTMLRQRRINAEVHRRAHQEDAAVSPTSPDPIGRAFEGMDAALDALARAEAEHIQALRAALSDLRVALTEAPDAAPVDTSPVEAAPPSPFDVPPESTTQDAISLQVRVHMALERTTQTALARELGISQAQVSQRMNGKTEWAIHDLDVLLALGVPLRLPEVRGGEQR